MRGECFTEVSPADNVPSHGTNRFGLRYAFDFIQVGWKKLNHSTKTVLKISKHQINTDKSNNKKTVSTTSVRVGEMYSY